MKYNFNEIMNDEKISLILEQSYENPYKRTNLINTFDNKYAIMWSLLKQITYTSFKKTKFKYDYIRLGKHEKIFDMAVLTLYEIFDKTYSNKDFSMTDEDFVIFNNTFREELFNTNPDVYYTTCETLNKDIFKNVFIPIEYDKYCSIDMMVKTVSMLNKTEMEKFGEKLNTTLDTISDNNLFDVEINESFTL